MDSNRKWWFGEQRYESGEVTRQRRRDERILIVLAVAVVLGVIVTYLVRR